MNSPAQIIVDPRSFFKNRLNEKSWKHLIVFFVVLITLSAIIQMLFTLFTVNNYPDTPMGERFSYIQVDNSPIEILNFVLLFIVTESVEFIKIFTVLLVLTLLVMKLFRISIPLKTIIQIISYSMVSIMISRNISVPILFIGATIFPTASLSQTFYYYLDFLIWGWIVYTFFLIKDGVSIHLEQKSHKPASNSPLFDLFFSPHSFFIRQKKRWNVQAAVTYMILMLGFFNVVSIIYFLFRIHIAPSLDVNNFLGLDTLSRSIFLFSDFITSLFTDLFVVSIIIIGLSAYLSLRKTPIPFGGLTIILSYSITSTGLANAAIFIMAIISYFFVPFREFSLANPTITNAIFYGIYFYSFFLVREGVRVFSEENAK